MKEYVLWGTPKGFASWHEEILYEGKSRAECEKQQELYQGGTYDRFRISEIDLSIPPDFKNTLNI